MLAQNFKTAAELGIKDVELDALIKVLGMLERGEIPAKAFNMGRFRPYCEDRSDAKIVAECGTIGCLCGWANFISDGAAFPEIYELRGGDPLMSRLPRGARHAFAMNNNTQPDLINRIWQEGTPASAAIALRSYLTTGEANWAEALA